MPSDVPDETLPPEKVTKLAAELIEHNGWETDWQARKAIDAASTMLALQNQLHKVSAEYAALETALATTWGGIAAEKARADKAEALLVEAVKALEAADVQFNCVVSPKGAYEAAKEAVRTTLAKIKEAKNG